MTDIEYTAADLEQNKRIDELLNSVRLLQSSVTDLKSSLTLLIEGMVKDDLKNRVTELETMLRGVSFRGRK